MYFAKIYISKMFTNFNIDEFLYLLCLYLQKDVSLPTETNNFFGLFILIKSTYLYAKVKKIIAIIF